MRRSESTWALVGVLGAAWASGLAAGQGAMGVERPAQGPAAGQVERLGRGVVAIHEGDGRVYVGWRLLGTDPADVAFNLYRARGQGEPRRLNAEPITASTNHVDEGVDLSEAVAYSVRPVIDGVEGEASARYTLPADAPARPYVSIRLQGDYVIHRAGIGDLDGDGELDYVFIQPDQVTDPGVWHRPTDTWKLEAYRHDGELLWRRDLGPNIVQGVWWSPYTVCDLDGDGRAEVVVKTAPVDEDYRNDDGRVLEGPEWLSVLDGRTGGELARADWIPRGRVSDWGDDYGNRVNRNLICIACLDGRRPSVVIFRGTYELMKAQAWNYRDGGLTKLWDWRREGGGGFHNVRVADVDGDGRDEVLNGSICINPDGTTRWVTGEGHGDRMHLADIDPDRPGLEVWYVQEGGYEHPFHLRDARTGELIWGVTGDRGDVGRGVAADVHPGYRGMECWSSASEHLYSAAGEAIGPKPRSQQFAVWWDGDPLRELAEDGRIVKYDHETGETVELATTVVKRYAERLVADLFGDWREEIICVVPGEVRVYTTTIPADRRLPTLMQDPLYRNDVATMSMGYVQPAHTRFFLGHEADR